jgi:hypothetical protein
MISSNKDKDDDIKDSFDQFPRYHMKTLLGDFNEKVGREGGHF